MGHLSTRAVALAVLATFLAVGASARASVTEPDGTVVPTNASVGNETQVQTLFTNRGEALLTAELDREGLAALLVDDDCLGDLDEIQVVGGHRSNGPTAASMSKAIAVAARNRSAGSLWFGRM